jgi:hypothetical protein
MNKNISLSGIKEDVFQLGLMVEDGGTHGDGRDVGLIREG